MFSNHEYKHDDVDNNNNNNDIIIMTILMITRIVSGSPGATLASR